jgi:P27 family predicted phage terminase small subunit
MPGPARTPQAILEARGSWLAKDRAKTDPHDDVRAPEPPRWLSKVGREHWTFIVPLLIARRTISAADFGHLVGMCEWWAEYVGAIAALRKLGKKSFKGHLLDHPRVRQRSAWEQYTKAAQRFGVTPADKTKVNAAPPAKPKVDKPTVPVLRIAR